MCYSPKYSGNETAGSSSPDNYGTVQSSQDYTPPSLTGMGGPRRSNDQRALRNASPMEKQISADAAGSSGKRKGLKQFSLLYNSLIK